MRPEGEYECFKVNLPVSVTGGAVIAAAIYSISLDLESMMKEKYCLDRRACLSDIFVLKRAF
jgi:hypothetical protein